MPSGRAAETLKNSSHRTVNTIWVCQTEEPYGLGRQSKEQLAGGVGPDGWVATASQAEAYERGDGRGPGDGKSGESTFQIGPEEKAHGACGWDKPGGE